jgi:Mrp family chromosome partitioning ATPase
MLLPSGPLPPIPADVLSSQRMLDVIGVLKARAHYILFDAPPVLAATDAVLLGAKLDGVVLVVRVGATRRDQAARARQTLERVHVRLLGAVMTNAPRDSLGSY